MRDEELVMTVKSLVEASGIMGDPRFEAIDYAIPIGEGGRYPHNGQAVSVYWKGEYFPELITFKMLAIRAKKLGEEHPDINAVLLEG